MKHYFGHASTEVRRAIESQFDSELKPRAVLCVGSVTHLNGGTTCAKEDIVVTVEVPFCTSSHPANTVWVRFDSEAVVDCQVHDLHHGQVDALCMPFRDLFVNMQLGTVMASRLSCLVQGSTGSFVPLFVVQGNFGSDNHGRRIYSDIYCYSQVRFTTVDSLFVRTSAVGCIDVTESDDVTLPLPVSRAHSLPWFEQARDVHRANYLFLNNHQCYYRKCFTGREIEVKFTLPLHSDIWKLTVDCFNCIAAGRLPGFIVEYRDDFQQWDYLNVLFDVTGPPGEEGYVSFIPTTDGRHIAKRKWFVGDQLIRRESITPAQFIEDYKAYLQDVLKVTAEPLPPFRRVRYDVNFESERSGHVYGIFFDRSCIVDSPHVELVQCEVEYLRSRTLIEPCEDFILEELECIVSWVRELLREFDIAYQEGYYSKLSFLRDFKENGSLSWLR